MSVTQVTAVYDVQRGCARRNWPPKSARKPASKLARVSRNSRDVVITVVTDDKAQLAIFTNKKDNLLMGAKGRTSL